MFDVSVNISLSEVITGLILYAIIHGTYKVLTIIEKQIATESAHIIREHVKSAHGGHFKRCTKDQCITPEMLVPLA